MTRAVIGQPGSALNTRVIESDWRIFDFTGTKPLRGRGFIQQDLVVSLTVLVSIYLSVRGILRLEPNSVLRFG